MVLWALTPNVVSYSAAMSACEKGKQWEEAFALLQEIVRRVLTPNVVSYSAAMSAFETGGQWQCALGLLDDMTNEGFT